MKDSKNTISDDIKCPSCGAVIPITETLNQQLKEKARAELQQEWLQKQNALVARETALETKEAEIRKAETSIDKQVAELLAIEKAKLSQDALKKARGEVSLEVEELRAGESEAKRLLQEAQKNEIQLRKEKRVVEAAKEAVELDVARQIDAERKSIREKALKDADADHRVKDAEKDHKLQEALRVSEDLRRKLEQGSQQAQGEVLEVGLESMLRDRCPLDDIHPVPKGIRGADVLQQVRTGSGFACGLILWEAKRTKDWGKGWISKLKGDQQEAKADIAVLVTDVLPKDIDCFGQRDEVWITLPRYVPELVAAFRQILAEVAQAKRSVAGKNEMVETLYDYMTGPEFRNRVSAIVGAFKAMKEDLEEEKRVTNKRWAKREKQLENVTKNTSGMYGDLEGLIGTSLKPIALLEFTEADSPEVGTVLSLAAEAEK